jgi:pimeloyl-ACP methyl ester carboxylesterase
MPPVDEKALAPEAPVVPGVLERAVGFDSGGKTLRGVLSTPETSGRAVRGVVLLHGWATYRIGPHAMLVKLARELAGLGVAALRFDFRGRGESAGGFGEAGLDEMIDDAARAAAFLRGETRVERVAAVGLCSGANVGLAAAALEEGSFDRVAALSALPFQSHRSFAQELRRRRGRLRELGARALAPSTWWRLVTGRVRAFRVLGNLFRGEGSRKVQAGPGAERNLKDSRRDVMAALATYPGRLLFVWGGADDEGMGAKSHFEGFSLAHSLDARFEVIAGSNHNFYLLAWESELFDLVTRLVTERHW